jgi:hypothetical protein
MITKIETTEDVKSFAKQLIAEGVSFHPDDDFEDYVNYKDGAPTYSKQEAAIRNELMNSCFVVCEKEGVDIYDIMHEVSLIETGWDKYIPLPSQPYHEHN